MTEPSVPTSSSANLTPSFVRTAVPLIIGPIVARLGFDDQDPTTLLTISAVASWVYYVIVRLLELRAPTLGYLLGLAKAPSYAPSAPTDGELADTESDGTG